MASSASAGGEDGNFLSNFYHSLEDGYYNLCDSLEEKGLKIYEYWVEPIEKHGVPSFPVSAVVLVALLAAVGVLGAALLGIASVPGAPTSLAVTVLSADGVPVPGASVTMLSGSGKLDATTNQQGQVIFDGIASNVDATIRVTHPSYKLATRQVKTGEQLSAEITLDAIGTLVLDSRVEVFVLDEQTQRPIAGATAIYWDGQTQKVYSDGQGKVLLSFKGESINAFFQADNYDSKQATVGKNDKGKKVFLTSGTTLPGEPEEGPPECVGSQCRQETGSVAVTVVDEKGNAVDADVSLYESGSSAPLATRTTTQGIAQFNEITQVGNSVYAVAKPLDAKYSQAQSDVDEVGRGELELEVTVKTRVVADQSIAAITVVDAKNGNALEGVDVLLFVEGNSNVADRQQTNENGVASFDVEPTLGLVVAAWKEGYLPERAALPKTKRNATIRLQKTIIGNKASVIATVKSSDASQVIEAATVEAIYSDGLPVGLPPVRSNEVGEALLSGLPVASNIKVKAKYGVLEGTSELLQLAPEEQKRVDVLLNKPVGTIVLSVRNDARQPVSGANATASVGSNVVSRCTTDVAGTCRLENVDAQQNVELKVVAAGYVEKTLSVSLAPKQVVTVTVNDFVPASLQNASRLLVSLRDAASCDGATTISQGSPLDKGKAYCVHFDYNIPANDSDPNGFFFRVNADGASESDFAEIVGYQSFAQLLLSPEKLVVSRADNYRSGNFVCDDADRQTSNENRLKWVNYEFRGVQGNRGINAWVFVKPTAKGSDALKISFFSYAVRNGKYYRVPVDNELGNAKSAGGKDWCNAATNSLYYNVADGNTAINDKAALSLAFSKKFSGAFSPAITLKAGETFFVKANARYFNERTSPSLRLFVGDAAGRKRSYATFLNASSSALPAGEVALGNSDSQLDFDAALVARTQNVFLFNATVRSNATIPVPAARIFAELSDENGVMVATKGSIAITGTAPLSAGFSPTSLTANKDTDLTITLFSGSTPVEDTVVRLEPADATVFGQQTGFVELKGDGTAGNGKDGKYVFKRVHPLRSGKIIVAAGGVLDARFAESESQLPVFLNNFVTIDKSSGALGCAPDNARVTNTLDFAVAPVTVSLSSACVQATNAACARKQGDACVEYRFNLNPKETKTLSFKALLNGECVASVASNVSALTTSYAEISFSASCEANAATCSLQAVPSNPIGGSDAVTVAATFNNLLSPSPPVAEFSCGGATKKINLVSGDGKNFVAATTCTFPQVSGATAAKATVNALDAVLAPLGVSCDADVLVRPQGAAPSCVVKATPIAGTKAAKVSVDFFGISGGEQNAFVACQPQSDPQQAPLQQQGTFANATTTCDYADATGSSFVVEAFAGAAQCSTTFSPTSGGGGGSCVLGSETIPSGSCSQQNAAFMKCANGVPIVDGSCCATVLGSNYEFVSTVVDGRVLNECRQKTQATATCSVQLEPNPVAAGSPTTITVTYEGLATPPANGNIPVKCGTQTLNATGCTGVEGECTAACIVPTSTTTSVTAFPQGASCANTLATTSVSGGGEQSVNNSCSVIAPERVGVNQEFDIVVSYNLSAPLASPTISVDCGNARATATGCTGSRGECLAKCTLPQAGSAAIKATLPSATCATTTIVSQADAASCRITKMIPGSAQAGVPATYIATYYGIAPNSASSLTTTIEGIPQPPSSCNAVGSVQVCNFSFAFPSAGSKTIVSTIDANNNCRLDVTVGNGPTCELEISPDVAQSGEQVSFSINYRNLPQPPSNSRATVSWDGASIVVAGCSGNDGSCSATQPITATTTQNLAATTRVGGASCSSQLKVVPRPAFVCDDGVTAEGQCKLESTATGSVPSPQYCTTSGFSFNSSCCSTRTGFSFDESNNVCARITPRQCVVKGILNGQEIEEKIDFGTCSQQHPGFSCVGSASNPALLGNNSCCVAKFGVGFVFNSTTRGCSNPTQAVPPTNCDVATPQGTCQTTTAAPNPLFCGPNGFVSSPACCTVPIGSKEGFVASADGSLCVAVPAGRIEPTCNFTLVNYALSADQTSYKATLNATFEKLQGLIGSSIAFEKTCDEGQLPPSRSATVVASSSASSSFPCSYSRGFFNYSVQPQMQAIIVSSQTGEQKSVACNLVGPFTQATKIEVNGTTQEKIVFNVAVTAGGVAYIDDKKLLGALQGVRYAVSAASLPLGLQDNDVRLALSCDENAAPVDLQLSQTTQRTWTASCDYSSPQNARFPVVHKAKAFYQISKDGRFSPPTGMAFVGKDFASVVEYKQPIASGLRITKRTEPTLQEVKLAVDFQASFKNVPQGSVAAEYDCGDGSKQPLALVVSANGDAAGTFRCSYTQDATATASLSFSKLENGVVVSSSAESSLQVSYAAPVEQAICTITQSSLPPQGAIVVGDANKNSFLPRVEIVGVAKAPKSVQVLCGNSQTLESTSVGVLTTTGTEVQAFASFADKCSYDFSSLPNNAKTATAIITIRADGQECGGTTISLLSQALSGITLSAVATPIDANGFGTQQQISVKVTGAPEGFEALSPKATVSCGAGSTPVGVKKEALLQKDVDAATFTGDVVCEYAGVQANTTRIATIDLSAATYGKIKSTAVTMLQQPTPGATPVPAPEFKACTSVIPLLLLNGFGGLLEPRTGAVEQTAQSYAIKDGQLGNGEAFVLTAGSSFQLKQGISLQTAAYFFNTRTTRRVVSASTLPDYTYIVVANALPPSAFGRDKNAYIKVQQNSQCLKVYDLKGGYLEPVDQNNFEFKLPALKRGMKLNYESPSVKIFAIGYNTDPASQCTSYEMDAATGLPKVVGVRENSIKVTLFGTANPASGEITSKSFVVNVAQIRQSVPYSIAYSPRPASTFAYRSPSFKAPFAVGNNIGMGANKGDFSQSNFGLAITQGGKEKELATGQSSDFENYVSTQTGVTVKPFGFRNDFRPAIMLKELRANAIDVFAKYEVIGEKETENEAEKIDCSSKFCDGEQLSKYGDRIAKEINKNIKDSSSTTVPTIVRTEGAQENAIGLQAFPFAPYGGGAYSPFDYGAPAGFGRPLSPIPFPSSEQYAYAGLSTAQYQTQSILGGGAFGGIQNILLANAVAKDQSGACIAAIECIAIMQSLIPAKSSSQGSLEQLAPLFFCSQKSVQESLSKGDFDSLQNIVLLKILISTIENNRKASSQSTAAQSNRNVWQGIPYSTVPQATQAARSELSFAAAPGAPVGGVAAPASLYTPLQDIVVPVLSTDNGVAVASYEIIPRSGYARLKKMETIGKTVPSTTSLPYLDCSTNDCNVMWTPVDKPNLYTINKANLPVIECSGKWLANGVKADGDCQEALYAAKDACRQGDFCAVVAINGKKVEKLSVSASENNANFDKLELTNGKPIFVRELTTDLHEYFANAKSESILLKAAERQGTDCRRKLSSDLRSAAISCESTFATNNLVLINNPRPTDAGGEENLEESKGITVIISKAPSSVASTAKTSKLSFAPIDKLTLHAGGIYQLEIASTTTKEFTPKEAFAEITQGILSVPFHCSRDGRSFLQNDCTYLNLYEGAQQRSFVLIPSSLTIFKGHFGTNYASFIKDNLKYDSKNGLLKLETGLYFTYPNSQIPVEYYQLEVKYNSQTRGIISFGNKPLEVVVGQTKPTVAFDDANKNAVFNMRGYAQNVFLAEVSADGSVTVVDRAQPLKDNTYTSKPSIRYPAKTTAALLIAFDEFGNVLGKKDITQSAQIKQEACEETLSKAGQGNVILNLKQKLIKLAPGKLGDQTLDLFALKPGTKIITTAENRSGELVVTLKKGSVEQVSGKNGTKIAIPAIENGADYTLYVAPKECRITSTKNIEGSIKTPNSMRFLVIKRSPTLGECTALIGYEYADASLQQTGQVKECVVIRNEGSKCKTVLGSYANLKTCTNLGDKASDSLTKRELESP